MNTDLMGSARLESTLDQAEMPHPTGHLEAGTLKQAPVSHCALSSRYDGKTNPVLGMTREVSINGAGLLANKTPDQGQVSAVHSVRSELLCKMVHCRLSTGHNHDPAGSHVQAMNNTRPLRVPWQAIELGQERIAQRPIVVPTPRVNN